MTSDRGKRFLVPEVIQMSAMDCGPASLKCLFDGFRIPVDYDDLRDACRTDVDGTSINELERVANTLGLNTKQLVVPPDHVLLSEAAALPALAVMRHPNGNAHFVVIWSMVGNLVQMMDPAAGRIWRHRGDVASQLYRHTATVSSVSWREWASGEGFLRVLRRRIRDLGLNERDANKRISLALADPSWRSIAALDAAARSISRVAEAAGVPRLENASELLRHYVTDPIAVSSIPSEFWLVQPADEVGQQLLYRGAVLLRVRGTRMRAAEARPIDGEPRDRELSSTPKGDDRPRALTEGLLGSLRADGALNAVTLISLWLVNAVALVVQALLLRSVFTITSKLVSRAQLFAAMTALLALMTILFVERLASAKALYRLSRLVEMNFRRAVLRKIPRLGDRYFQTRLPADVAERSHSLVVVRTVPFQAARIVSCAFEVVLTATGIIWLDPRSWPLAVLLTAVALGIPLAVQPAFAGHELRVRVHTALLGRFYLDALLGVSTIRAHAAERAVRREHESLLTEWTRASLQAVSLAVSVTAAQMTVTLALAAALLFAYVRRQGDASGALLLVYWCLSLPLLATQFGESIQAYQPRRNAMRRVAEIIHAAEEPSLDTGLEGEADQKGAEISLSNVTVRLGGLTVLDSIDLHVGPGEHVAIVGPSGSGKSTLVGLVLGWSPVATGSVSLDGEPLTGEKLARLRAATAWVDPAVHIWNRTLIDNVTYGGENAEAASFVEAINRADLIDLLHSMPDGLQTYLGESGGLVSGGEGQRVRLARAMYRRKQRLVVLDEAFRGLDAAKRLELMRRARDLWSDATLLCVTHDFEETREFDRVVVIAGGHVVEDGRPSDLAVREGSAYSALLRSAATAREWWRREGLWRHTFVERGSVDGE
jgi:ATP-binding cassette subfamily B protein